MCGHDEFVKMIGEKDSAMYELLLEKLIPDLLQPMPTDHLQDLWEFADKIKEKMMAALRKVQVPVGLFKVKVSI